MLEIYRNKNFQTVKDFSIILQETRVQLTIKGIVKNECTGQSVTVLVGNLTAYGYAQQEVQLRQRA